MTKEILLKALKLMAKNLERGYPPPCDDDACKKLNCGSKECIKAIVDKYICMAMEAK